ncbi:Bacterial type II secretion system protein F domain protein [Corynebacterium capitovis DSM 44611]|uniref:type II secretion system F family protein n=1 Tax=Corynebacterium capitovis TaxID=131081 RepID=UPI000367344B|nr:type II secretion system F family protein [Corynebacterium capitovis]WKD56726.1 Bacterial type II secretion system protein F domain protein [Corynebacterium capitovis DSM 44611]
MTLLWLAGAALISPIPPSRRLGGRYPRSRRALIPTLGGAVAAVALASIVADRATVVISGCIVAATVIRTLSRRRQVKQRTRSREFIAGFLGHLVSHLQAGSSLFDATAASAERLPTDTPPGLIREIRRAVAAAQSGGAPEHALTSADTPELREVGALWALATSRGLPIAELLRGSRDRIDHELRHHAATEAALAGPKTTAVVLSALPLAGIAMGTAMGAHPLRILFGGGVGGILLLVGTILVCAGYLACAYIIEGAAS